MNFLIEKGADIGVQDETGLSLLHVAAEVLSCHDSMS